jgi:lysophospholipase L1-like esterase
MKPALISVSVVAAATLVGLAAAEILLRAANYRYTPLRIEVQNKSDWREFHVLEDSSFVSDSYLIWRPKAGAAVFNSQGYRGAEVTEEKDPHSVLIFAVGDSNTLGWGKKNGPNWPSYLGERLNRAERKYTVVNAGVWGYSSFQGLRWYQGILRFQPDVVLVSFGSNDAQQVTISDADFVKVGGRRLSLYLGQVLNRFRLGQLVLASSDRLFLREKEQLVARVSLPEYKANLEEFIRVGKSRNIQVVLLTRPYRGYANNPRWWITHAPIYNAAVLEVARNTGVTSIDVYTHFKDTPDLFADDSHFTEEGHRAMAQFVVENLESTLSRLR